MSTVYDTYYSTQDTSSALDSALADVTSGRDLSLSMYSQDHDPGAFFWEYDKAPESNIKRSHELNLEKYERSRDSLVTSAIDKSISLANKYGGTNLRTGDSVNVLKMLSDEVSLAGDLSMSEKTLSGIKASRRINNLRSKYLADIEDQRQEYIWNADAWWNTHKEDDGWAGEAANWEETAANAAMEALGVEEGADGVGATIPDIEANPDPLPPVMNPDNQEDTFISVADDTQDWCDDQPWYNFLCW